MMWESEREAVERWLERLLPDENTEPTTLHRAMRYSVFAGGKRLRPVLAIKAYHWAGGRGRRIYPIACALELIHTYSLIHDDLPAMDNDDLRRGKPTCHKAFGEAMAILAGDALHAFAFELLARSERIAVVREVAAAIGTKGLVAGQVADMESEGKDITADYLRYIHENKTAALITASLRVGAIMADVTTRELRSITSYGEALGLAFQIVDDILDVRGETKKLGKPVGSDAELDKATYPKLYGVDGSYKIASELIANAKAALPTRRDNRFFYDLADFIIERAY